MLAVPTWVHAFSSREAKSTNSTKLRMTADRFGNSHAAFIAPGPKVRNPVPSSKESANPRSLSGDPVSHSLAALTRSRSDGMERCPGVPRHRPGELDASRRAGARAEPTDHRTPVGRLRDQFWRTDFVRSSAPRGCASTPSANSWSQRRRASKRRCCGWSGGARRHRRSWAVPCGYRPANAPSGFWLVACRDRQRRRCRPASPWN